MLYANDGVKNFVRDTSKMRLVFSKSTKYVIISDITGQLDTTMRKKKNFDVAMR